ncbi:MAG: hypothetical protein HYZ42_01280, partial [Bacteroidetes bacterium]|nr:hypothetical protein [Bacteroidota bacterium]
MPFVYNYKAFSYNIFNSALVHLMIGVGLYVVALESNKRWILVMLFGSLACLQFFIKFSSTFLIVPAFALFWILYLDGNFWKKLIYIKVALLTGIVVTILVLYIDLKYPKEFFDVYVTFMKSLFGGNEYQGTHNSGHVLARYLKDIVLLGAKFIIQGWVLLCIAAFYIQFKVIGNKKIVSSLLFLLF